MIAEQKKKREGLNSLLIKILATSHSENLEVMQHVQTVFY